MPSQRDRSRGPGGPSRPGSRAPRRGGVDRAGDRTGTRTTGSLPSYDDAAGAAGPSARRLSRRSRYTGRAALLVLVLAVLTVSYASSLRAYLQQRAHIGDLRTQIAEREASINELEREKRRWEDPAFVKTQARKRFGYLMPGETGFEVIGADGRPLEAEATLRDPDEVIRTAPTAWWVGAWESMELAGNPPPPKPTPADLVDGTTKDREQGQQ